MGVVPVPNGKRLFTPLRALDSSDSSNSSESTFFFFPGVASISLGLVPILLLTSTVSPFFLAAGFLPAASVFFGATSERIERLNSQI